MRREVEDNRTDYQGWGKLQRRVRKREVPRPVLQRQKKSKHAALGSQDSDKLHDLTKI